jgi:putative ABC transport system permease protein
MFRDRLKQWFGSAELMVTAGRNAPSGLFRPHVVEPFADRLDYAVGTIRSSGLYTEGEEAVSFNLHALELEDARRMNPFTLVETRDLEPFTGRKIILSAPEAERLGLEPGDTVKLEIADHEHRFTLAGIAEPVGFFTDDGSNHAALVPISTLASFFDARGRVGIVYVKPAPGVSREDLLREMKGALPRYEVRETISEQELTANIQEMTVPFKVMLTLVLSISVFIVYSSFQVITTERLPVIGTFRSIGATRLMTNGVLFVESLVYGVLGGILGVILGIGAVYGMTYMTAGDWLRQTDMTLVVTSAQAASSFGLGVGLALVSSALPIVRVSKIPVKNIILNMVERHVTKNLGKRIAGTAFLVVGFAAPYGIPRSLALVGDTLSMLLALMGIIFLIPDLTSLFVLGFERIYLYLFGNVGILSAKNLRDNKSVINNIILLSIAISGLFFISTISDSVALYVTRHYREANYDIAFNRWNMGRETELALQTVEGVEGTYGIYRSTGNRIADSDDRIEIIHGVEPRKYAAYFDYTFDGDRMELLRRLDDGRNIIVTYTLRRQYGYRPGDVISLELGEKPRDYTVVGFFDSVNWNGSYGLVGARYLKMDTGNSRYGEIFIKTSGDPDEVMGNLTRKFRGRRFWARTVDDMARRNAESNEEFFAVLEGFSLVALIIGIVGIVNNFIIGFLERRRSFALYRSVGMSKVQLIRMIFIEALSGGIVGALAGIIAGGVLLLIVPHLMRAMNMPMKLFFRGITGLQFFLGGIIITLVASVSPALKSSKLNIIRSIKYE